MKSYLKLQNVIDKKFTRGRHTMAGGSVVAVLSVILSFFLLAPSSLMAQTTAFTYQGSLQSGGSPANGNFDLEFKLFDALTNGTQQGTTQQRLNVLVSNGVFAVSLDFGAVSLPGANRYLDIAVRTAGGGTFTPLTPRQLVNSAPYAVRSLNAANADNATNAANATTATNAQQLGGVAASQYVLTGDPRLSDPRDASSVNFGTAVLTGVVPIANGGTGSSTKNFVDLTTNQTNIGGNKTFTGTIGGNIVEAATQYNSGGLRILSASATGNLFAGVNAGEANSSGTNNSFFGTQAGSQNISGSNNAFFGRRSGTDSIAGSNNTMIGSGTSVTAGDISFATAIGAGASVSTNNTVVLGRALDAVQIPGSLNVAGTFTGNGSGLTNLNAGNITTGILAINRGGTGSSTQNFVDLVSEQEIGGNKTFTANTVSVQNDFNAHSIDATNLNVNNAVVNGNLGVGTNTPGVRVHIATSGQAQLDLQNLIGGGTPTSGSRWRIFADNVGGGGGNLTFGAFDVANNRVAFGIDNSGNLGIGTTSPTERLEIAGNVKATAMDATAYRIGGIRFLAGGGAFNFSTYVGDGAGAANPTGQYNTFVGKNAGFVMASGSENTFLGSSVGIASTGSWNTMMGRLAGWNLGAGDENVFVGNLAGRNFISGSGNIAIGSRSANQCGSGEATGNNNIYIGTASGAICGSPGISNSIAIGSFSAVFGSDQISIGGPNHTTIFFGDVRVQKSLAFTTLGTGGTTQLCWAPGINSPIASCSSSIRYKKNVNNFVAGLDLIRHLRPVSFNWKSNSMKDMGLVAEEVAEIEPLLVTYNDKGEVEGVKYDRIGVVAINAIKEQQEEIEALKKQIAALKALLCAKNAEAGICKE